MPVFLPECPSEASRSAAPRLSHPLCFCYFAHMKECHCSAPLPVPLFPYGNITYDCLQTCTELLLRVAFWLAQLRLGKNLMAWALGIHCGLACCRDPNWFCLFDNIVINTPPHTHPTTIIIKTKGLLNCGSNSRL